VQSSSVCGQRLATNGIHPNAAGDNFGCAPFHIDTILNDHSVVEGEDVGMGVEPGVKT